jgi:hypothetical protein
VCLLCVLHLFSLLLHLFPYRTQKVIVSFAYIHGSTFYAVSYNLCCCFSPCHLTADFHFLAHLLVHPLQMLHSDQNLVTRPVLCFTVFYLVLQLIVAPQHVAHHCVGSPTLLWFYLPTRCVCCFQGHCNVFVISTLSYLGFVPVFTAWSLKCHCHGQFDVTCHIPSCITFLLSPSLCFPNAILHYHFHAPYWEVPVCNSSP